MQLSSNPTSLARRITPLPDDVINQIAAGEVVERPSSCLKELIENALDAGSTRIEVSLVNGGLDEIVVLDNGAGIHAEDLPLAICRHATSKLAQFDDLEKLATFGFRGEALSSMASVSELQIRSRTSLTDSALRLTVNCGKIIGTVREAAPVGTEVKIRGLFSQLPARLKYLRSAATELSHGVRIVRELALGNPHAQFALYHGGRSLLNLVSRTRAGRIREALPWDWEPLHFLEQTDDLNFEAYLSPREQVQDRGEISLFINGRPIRHKALHAAIRASYLDCLGPHHEPSGVLYFDIRPDWLDVNVHPQKLEVRLLKQEALYGLITRKLKERLGKNPQSSEISNRSFPAYAAPANRRFTYLGEGNSKFLLFRDESGVLFVDRTHLKETLRFRDLTQTAAAQRTEKRPCTPPLIISLSAESLEMAEKTREDLMQAGFEIEPFGGHDLAVTAVPRLLPPTEVKKALEEILVLLKKENSSHLPLILAVLAGWSTKSPEPDPLNEKELAWLADGLDQLEPEATCPHGQPLVYRISFKTVENQLERC